MKEKQTARSYFLASGVSALVNFPLWKVSALAQSGFKPQVPTSGFGALLAPYSKTVATAFGFYMHAFKPPYKGVIYVLGGMTWARGAIFFGSDWGRQKLSKDLGMSYSVSTILPPLLISTFVQITNQPVVRGTIAVQWPEAPHKSVYRALLHVYKQRGILGLWHGTSAGILKTVPKYCSAVLVKDYMDDHLPSFESYAATHNVELWRSAIKSVSAGIAGAALTNPFDVIRNEMFKTDMTLVAAFRHLNQTEGAAWLWRGVNANLVSVAFPIAMTIFLTDLFSQYPLLA
eukprot:c3898_g1_i1.p1 GENE.c3898_g1_i1~~c3898_g1_i1.p1  ORF type:complete len:288 (+),score=117.65 c3898_g1_i1:16-879(+)